MAKRLTVKTVALPWWERLQNHGLGVSQVVDFVGEGVGMQAPATPLTCNF